MQRRDFITLLGGAAAAWPFVARAQQPSSKVFRIGFLGLPTADSLPKRPEAFRAGLGDLGYQEGRDFVIEYRWADGNYDRLPALLADLIRLKVDVILAHGTPGVLAAKQATTTIPIVMAVVGDALGSGIVSSLARPGGNVTGMTFFNPELAAKRLELLKETLPGLTDVGLLLLNPINESILPEMSRFAQPLKLELHQFDVRVPTEFEGAFAASSGLKNVDPVTLPSGRARLDTIPDPKASPTTATTMGIVVVAFLAARTPGVPWVTITSTLSRTRSANRAGSRS